MFFFSELEKNGVFSGTQIILDFEGGSRVAINRVPQKTPALAPSYTAAGNKQPAMQFRAIPVLPSLTQAGQS